jgi:hypothetical protein
MGEKGILIWENNMNHSFSLDLSSVVLVEFQIISIDFRD